MDEFNRFSNTPRESPTPKDTRDTIPIEMDRKGKININQLKGKRKYLWAYATIMKILNRIVDKDVKAIKKKYRTMKNKIKGSEVKKKVQKQTTLQALVDGDTNILLKDFIESDEQLNNAVNRYDKSVKEIGPKYSNDIQQLNELSAIQIENAVDETKFPEFPVLEISEEEDIPTGVKIEEGAGYEFEPSDEAKFSQVEVEPGAGYEFEPSEEATFPDPIDISKVKIPRSYAPPKTAEQEAEQLAIDLVDIATRYKMGKKAVAERKKKEFIEKGKQALRKQEALKQRAETRKRKLNEREERNKKLLKMKQIAETKQPVVNPITKPVSTPPSKQEIQNALNVRKRDENIVKSLEKAEKNLKALQPISERVNNMEGALKLIQEILTKEQKQKIQKALDKSTKKEEVDKILPPDVVKPKPPQEGPILTGDIQEDIIEEVNVGAPQVPRANKPETSSFKLPDVGEITKSIATGALAGGAAILAYTNLVSSDNQDVIQDVREGLATDADVDLIDDTSSVDSAESTVSNTYRRVMGRRMPEQDRTVLSAVRGSVGSSGYVNFLRIYNFMVRTNQVVAFLTTVLTLLDATNILPTSKIKDLVNYYRPTTDYVKGLKVQEEQIQIPTQVIQQDDQGKGTLRPKFIIPTDKIFELTGNEVNTDLLEFSAFDYVVPTSEGTLGNVQNNPLKREAMTQERILMEGGGIHVDSVFGAELPYTQEQLRDLFLGEPLPRMEFKPMSEYEVGDNQVQPFDYNGDRTAIEALSPYKNFTNVHQMNVGFESSQLYGYQP